MPRSRRPSFLSCRYALLRHALFSLPGYEAEIRRLAEADRRSTLTASEKEKLASLRAEVERIQKTKDEYLEKHPEHRKFVYPNEEARLKAERDKAEGREASGSGGPLYGKDGRLVSLALVCERGLRLVVA
jgi:vacuolar-type H+-ATPase subunit I/STV1